MSSGVSSSTIGTGGVPGGVPGGRQRRSVPPPPVPPPTSTRPLPPPPRQPPAAAFRGGAPPFPPPPPAVAVRGQAGRASSLSSTAQPRPLGIPARRAGTSQQHVAAALSSGRPTASALAPPLSTPPLSTTPLSTTSKTTTSKTSTSTTTAPVAAVDSSSSVSPARRHAPYYAGGGYSYTTSSTHATHTSTGSYAPQGGYNISNRASPVQTTKKESPARPTTFPLAPSQGVRKPSVAASSLAVYPSSGGMLAVGVAVLGAVLAPLRSNLPRATLLGGALALYAADLAQVRGVLLVGSWATVVVLTLVTAWCRLLETEDEEGGMTVLLLLLQIFCHGLVFCCSALWVNAQLAWLGGDTRHRLQASLHALVPPLAAAVGTHALATTYVEAAWGRQTAGHASPFLFAALLWAGMLSLGSVVAVVPALPANAMPSSSSSSAPFSSPTPFLVSPTVAWGHLCLLYLLPVVMHLATHLRRMLATSGATSLEDWYDLILVSLLPYLAGRYGLTWAHTTGLRRSPYVRQDSVRPTTSLTHTFQPAILIAVAALALQQRYLLPWSHALSYYFFANHVATWLLSAYWFLAVLTLLFAMSFWGQRSVVTNAPLMGDYHEDIVQVAISMTGLFLGKAFGLPWNFTPLPVLAFLGLTLWVSTRMLRYLVIFLFVVHATGVVVFTYRFAGMEHQLPLPLPGVQLSLVRLGLVVTSASIVVGLVAGLAVRSTGGIGAQWIKRLDATGILLVVYAVMLQTLEIALLKRPIPSSELVGVSHDLGQEETETLYDPLWAYGTAALLLGMAAILQRNKSLSPTMASLTMALAVGKTISIYVDTVDSSAQAQDSEAVAPGWDVWLRSLVTALVCVLLFAPRVFLQPVHVKTSAAPRSRRHSKGAVDLPPGTGRMVAVYVLFFLPSALMMAVPYVIYPLANAIRGDWRGDSYYRVQAPLSEMAGATLLLWGLACLAMLNHYLPDGGGEVWKKLAALTFLMGTGIVFAAPALGIRMEAASNPFAAISSLGSQLISKGKSRTGGWGLLSACFATLLAITGPLELKERRSESARRDNLLLLRTMIFSLMLGGGLAWFLVMLCMRDAPMVILVLTTVSSLTLSFLGTIAAVLGYFLPLDDFGEAQQVFSIWLVALPLLAPISGLPWLFGSADAHPFGVDGWLSTYLAVGSATASAFCLAVKSRPTKNPATRGLGNTSCLLALLCVLAILYGRYGVAGMDANYDVTTVLGVPASIFGTILVMPVLMALDGEASVVSGGRSRRVTSSSKTATSTLGINLLKLSSSNHWALAFLATGLVFLAASLYSIGLRGAGLGSLMGGSTIAKTHEEVFRSVFGDKSDDHDLATLAKKAISHSHALATSAKLAAGGFWTADSLMGPLWHTVGLVACSPSLWLLYSQKWLGSRVASATVLMALPLNVVPLLLCRGVPSLQAAAAVSAMGGVIQWSVHRQADYRSQMSM